MSCNRNYALGQYAELCLNTGVFEELHLVAQWTVNPYVASSSLARGASFLDVFAQPILVLFPTVAKMSLT